jgi:DNA-binding transcriptional MerR regulator
MLPLDDVNVKLNGTVVDVKVREGEHRIDELALLAGTTVRNVRAYQDRGLLPRTRREGRVVLYGEEHVARVKLIVRLLERGYTLANIGELIGAWQSGQDVGDLLGLEAALVEPWTEEAPTVMDAAELAAMFGDSVGPDEITTAVGAGLIETAGVTAGDDLGGPGHEASQAFLVQNPRLLHVGAELVGVGIPLRAVLELGAELRNEIDRIATSFVDLIVRNVFDPVGEPIPRADVPRLAEIVRRLRPLAKEAVDAELADAMERHVHEELIARLDRMLAGLERHETEAS